MNDLKGLIKEFNEVKNSITGLTNDDVLCLMILDRMDVLNRRLFELNVTLRMWL